MKNPKVGTQLLSKLFIFHFSFFILLWLLPVPVQAIDEPDFSDAPSFEADEALFWGEEKKIITATKFLKSVKFAPAIATVITAEEIRLMGARDIMDVLRRVPGIEIQKSVIGKEEIVVRGIRSLHTKQVKFLIDGHSVNDSNSGGALWVFDALSLKNVKRIEIIRGPGSALYGSNAFTAVINVITKNGEDMDGITISGGGGSFDTGRASLQAGKRFGDLDVALSVDFFTSSGERLGISSDILGNSGNTDDDEKKLEADFRISYKGLSFNSKYVLRKKSAYIGAGNAVNDETEIDVQQFFGELAYKHSFNDTADLTAKAYLDDFDWDAYWEILPEGTGPYVAGMLGNPSLRERAYGGEFQLDYKPFKNNRLTIGALAEVRKQSDVSHHANFNPTTFAPLAAVMDITSTGNWNQNKNRYIWAAYLQDVWDITKNIGITLGVRHDHYSDFGNTTNPRAALVLKLVEGLDVKFLFGTAFRAPTFEELYNVNNLTVLGSTTLKPEKMRTYEASVGYTRKNLANLRVTYFYTSFRDRIELVAQAIPGTFTYGNTPGAKVQGIEAEVKWHFSKETFVYANYTFQEGEARGTNRQLAGRAEAQGKCGL